ncbi:chaperonin: PROVISIONAL [Gigaspora margarita]|uniref:Chaperonin: PROVISIONAL n=1 Tax=Gigaspora margarita TaxID=4874 RepID=A0A8H4B2H7_GIGMA|nr:chaperonin: PROVISIONAL [Gigaspora margarita]
MGNYPNTQQTNYVIDEAEMPDDGKQGKGVNCTLSLGWHAIQKYNRDGEGFQYYNFKKYFETFKKLPNIQKYYHFNFTLQNPGVVFYKDKIEDEYKSYTIRSFIFDANTLPPIISIRSLSLKRQEELYKEISPYVDIPFRDITCPKPNKIDENLSET